MIDEVLIKLEGISKYYGPHRILTGINLELKQGEVLGIVGANGSGKSTVLKIVLGLVYHTDGFLRCPTGAREIRVGALLERPGFFPGFNLEKNLVLFSGGMKPKSFDEVTERLGLKQWMHKKFGNCSTGIQKRSELAAMLLRDPGVILMDEPVSGLDPAGISAFRSIIREMKEKNGAVILTDHALDEMEKVCTRICFLKQGIMQANIPMDELRSRFKNMEEAYRFFNLKIS